MKMFKKLMAVALAGVMALAVLTGCGTSVNEKEIIKIFNDSLKTAQASSIMKDKGIAIKEVKADSDVKAMAQKVAGILASDVKDNSTIKTQMAAKESDIMKALDDTQNEYTIGYTQKIKYDSKLYNSLDSGIDAISILMSSKTFNPVVPNGKYEHVKDAVSLIGFADVTINGVTYTIAVIKTPTQAVKA